MNYITCAFIGLGLGTAGLAIFFGVQFLHQRLESQRLQALMLAGLKSQEQQLMDSEVQRQSSHTLPAVSGNRDIFWVWC